MEERTGQKPHWLKKTWKETGEMREVEALVRELGLNTVCREASCPNYSECFGRGIATFMILGANCTRSCGFCGVRHTAPEPPDPEEPARVAEAVSRLKLDYVVITSVTRDDLPDGGAWAFAATVMEIRKRSSGTKVETLIPDFGGSEEALGLVIEASPDVISHNMETVRELYAKVRPQADYERSLAVLRRIAAAAAATSGDRAELPALVSQHSCDHGGAARPAAAPLCKSGIMVGVGETDAQVLALMDDLRAVGCAILTIGQYLRPSEANIPVEEYIRPEVFDHWAEAAVAKGFKAVASAPFVRSSYHAEEAVSGGGS